MDSSEPLNQSNQVRKLVKDDIDNIARLVATRKLTEKEACLTLGIKPHQWIVWKGRNKRSVIFESAIQRIRADAIRGLIDNIENVSNGIGVKQRDWRAGAWIAERLAPERFALNQSQAPANVTNNLQIVALHETLKKVFNSPIVDSSAVCDVASVSIADDGIKQLKQTSIKLPTRRK